MGPNSITGIFEAVRRLYQTYEQEVIEKKKKGLLEEKTAKTYLRHASTFVRWCKNDFIPGVRKEGGISKHGM
jgi:hypothetical protein